MKKVISLFLILILVFSIACPIAFAQDSYTTEIPTIYLHGQGRSLYVKDEEGTEQRIYPLNLDAKEIVGDLYENLHDPFNKALLTGNWDDWCDATVDTVSKIFEPIALDENGNVKDGSYHHWNDYRNKKDKDGRYNIEAYNFIYDWRLDPCTIADELNTYINSVLHHSNCSKVNIIGRCFGANVLLAYLDKYGTKKVNSTIFYCMGFDGFDVAGNIYTGNIYFDADALTRFVDNYLTSGEYADDDLYAAAVALVDIMNSLKQLNLATDVIQTIYNKVYTNVVPRIILRTFGTMPSFWGAVGDEYYEDAKSFVYGDNAEQYSGLIEKTDNFHYNVLNKSDEIINKAIDSGVNVYIIAKYGLQIIPVIKDADIQSDNMLELSSASFGATCSPVNGELSFGYIYGVKENGLEKYISPDKQVDASTCYLPDHTWFIKDLNHLNMPDCVDSLFVYLLDADNYVTVFDSEQFPQYLLYDSENDEIVPLNSENQNTNDEWDGSFFKKLISLFKSIFKLIISKIKK